MPIFDSYGGRSSLLTAEESDRLNNPGKYDYDQEKYDQLVAVLLPKIAARRAADRTSREVVSSSYAAFGPTVPGGAGMSTKPLFSLAGRSGHTSGGLAGSSSELEYAEGGVVEAPDNFVKRYDQGGPVPQVQHMKMGGMASPYATSMRTGPAQQTFTVPVPAPQLSEQPLGPLGQMGGQQQGVGGLFERLPQNQMGMMQAQMGGAPLEVYGNYLNNTYTAPAAETSQTKVTEFIDLVDQAERAHFGAEESFGYGGGSYQQGLLAQYAQQPSQPTGQGATSFTPTSQADLERFRVY